MNPETQTSAQARGARVLLAPLTGIAVACYLCLTLLACGGDEEATKLERLSTGQLACPAQVLDGESCNLAEGTVCVHEGFICGTGWGDGLYKCTCTGGAFRCMDLSNADCKAGVRLSGQGGLPLTVATTGGPLIRTRRPSVDGSPAPSRVGLPARVGLAPGPRACLDLLSCTNGEGKASRIATTSGEPAFPAAEPRA